MSGVPITGEDMARALAGVQGHPLASDLLAMAQQNNPHVEVDFVEEAMGEGTISVLEVKTERGAMRLPRDPEGGWLATFQEMGLL